MKLLAIHTCPMWKTPEGPKIGMEYDPRGGEEWPVVGWVNVLVLRLFGREHRLLAVEDE